MHVIVSPYTKYTWGHLVRCLAVADALVALGHRVTFVGGSEARDKVTAAGYPFVEHVSIERQDRLEPETRNRPNVRAWWSRSLAAGREILRQLAADVVLTDLQPMLNVAAALECVPSASLLNLELVQSPLGAWLPALDAIFASIELPRWAAARVFGDSLIVCDAPDVIGLRDLAPPLAARISSSVREVRFVGPVLGRDGPRWSLPRGTRTRVIVSFGESGGDAVLGPVLDGCADIDADFIVVGKPRAATADGRRATVTFVDFLPEFANELCRADALITHGGHGTLVQALCTGIPTLVVPTTLERELNAQRLRGVGEVAPPNRSQVRATIGAQLLALLHDRSRDSARERLATSLSALGGANSAAVVIDQLARASLPESWR